MNRNLLRCCFALAAMVLSFSSASAAEFIVDALHGSDANSGLTTDTAKATIQAAVDLAVAPGDMVTVLPGEYLTSFIMNATQNGVTLRALGDVRISSNLQSTIQSASDVRVEGLTFASPAPTQLGIVDSSGIVIKRCRFLQGSIGLALGNIAENGNSNVLIRECLFAESTMHGLFYQVDQTGILVERCTFGRNAQAVGKGVATGPILVRNSAVFENTSASTTSASFSFCNFFGEQSPSGGTNFTDDPLFIDADNSVYHVRSGSPLLNQGQEGGPVGAFGQGFHTSKDLSKDEPPAQAGSTWGGWIDSNGNALSMSSLVELTNDANGHQEVILRMGVISAAIYSPVYNTGSPFTVIRSVDFAAFEDTTLPAGSRELIDQIQATPQREVRIRHAYTSFAQDPSSGPAFQIVVKQAAFKERAQFVQLELVLRKDGG